MLAEGGLPDEDSGCAREEKEDFQQGAVDGASFRHEALLSERRGEHRRPA